MLPVQNKIVYISRQMDTTPIDFKMIKEEMEATYSQFRHVILAKTLKNGIGEKIKYFFYMFRQMYHIATSKAVILDTYCIPVSILKQRKSLVVIQIWHAMGSLKQFGYSILDKKEGSSGKIAKLMKMHDNYSYVLTSSEYTKPYFAEAFHQPLENMVILPLPRADLLLNEAYKKDIRERIFAKYPKLKNTKREIIVYSPTFRKTGVSMEEGMAGLVNAVDFERYELIVKTHPLTEMEGEDRRAVWDEDFTSLELFLVADYIITDYSAIIFEALLLEKPLFFYTYDYEEYVKNRDFYIDYQASMPGMISGNPKEIMQAVESKEYSLKKIRKFRKLMIRETNSSYTNEFCEFLYSKICDGKGEKE